MIKKPSVLGRVFIKVAAFILVAVLGIILVSMQSDSQETVEVDDDTSNNVIATNSSNLPQIEAKGPVPVTSTTVALKSRQMATLTDMGYDDATSSSGFPVRGWYDVTGQGIANDYCREVGDRPNTFYACALAGGTDQYTKVDVTNKAFIKQK